MTPNRQQRRGINIWGAAIAAVVVVAVVLLLGHLAIGRSNGDAESEARQYLNPKYGSAVTYKLKRTGDFVAVTYYAHDSPVQTILVRQDSEGRWHRAVNGGW